MKEKIREKEESTWIKKPYFQLKTKKKEERRKDSITDRIKEEIWYFKNFAWYEVR